MYYGINVIKVDRNTNPNPEMSNSTPWGAVCGFDSEDQEQSNPVPL